MSSEIQRRRRRPECRWRIITTIAMTAEAMSGVRKSVLDAGMNDYVAKPIELDELWKALLKWIKPGDRIGGAVQRSERKLPNVAIRLPQTSRCLRSKVWTQMRVFNESGAIRGFTEICRSSSGEILQIQATKSAGRFRRESQKNQSGLRTRSKVSAGP